MQGSLFGWKVFRIGVLIVYVLLLIVLVYETHADVTLSITVTDQEYEDLKVFTGADINVTQAYLYSQFKDYLNKAKERSAQEDALDIARKAQQVDKSVRDSVKTVLDNATKLDNAKKK